MPHGTKQKRVMKKLKTKLETEMLRRNGPVIKSLESVPRLGVYVGKICERGISIRRNLPLSLSVKEFWKLTSIWQS